MNETKSNLRIECKAEVKGSKQFIPETYVILSQVTLQFEDLQEKKEYGRRQN